MSVTASRMLVDSICGNFGLPLLVLHDFDLSGFSILGTLGKTNRRYAFRNQIRVVDLGVRLEDVQGWRLEAEDVYIKDGKLRAALGTARRHGATEEELEFLGGRKRVELNAFTSGDMIKWLEGKLQENGVCKVIPERETLEAAYRRSLQIKAIEARMEEIIKETATEASQAKIPRGLARKVAKRLEADQELSWDRAIADLAGE